ncbi:MAG TPA: hypothetical protein VGX00_06165 [Thermoplasmata archaeon]|nr:hypothetical protein [Thermoplasmata archaeon]
MAKASPGAAMYGVLFLVAFGLTVVMLFTDKNLQTDFGAQSSGYYFHWYVVLVTGVADLVGAALLIVVRSRLAVKAGVAGSGFLSLVFLGDVFTYSQVGFASASDFAKYLFGFTYSGNDIRYLYDALLGVYLLAFVVGLVLWRRHRGERRPAAVAWDDAKKPAEKPPA